MSDYKYNKDMEIAVLIQHLDAHLILHRFGDSLDKDTRLQLLVKTKDF